MIATRIPVTVPFPPSPPRSEGIHLSRVIKNIAVRYKFVTADWLEEVDLVEVQGHGAQWWTTLSVDAQLRMSLGLAWEQYYLPLIGGVDHQPGELHLEGVYMTPDGESLNTVYSDEMEHAVHECKLTYKSVNTVRDLEDEWLWKAQIKGYCKGLNCRLAYLHVLFVCGDYGRPIRPMLKVWRIEFTQEELDESWELIRLEIQLRKQRTCL